MKILVTGATGFLGNNLIRKLPAENFETKAIVRNNSDLSFLKKTGAEIVTGDLFDIDDLHRAIEGCQVIVHAAANTAQWPTGFEHYERVNVEMTRLILEASLKANIERFIYVSSANAFGPGSKTAPGDETSPFTAVQYRSGYMRSKHEAQEMVLMFAKKYDLQAIIVNPTFMLGKYDLNPSSGKLVLTAYGRFLMPCPPGGKNFVHVNDVVRGIIGAMSHGKPGECYLMGNENLSYREFFIKMREVCGFPKHLIYLPCAFISALGYLGSFYEKKSGHGMKLDKINAPLLCADNYYSSAKAIRELQFRQTPIEQAIQDTLV